MTHYDTLGIMPCADDDVIRKAYRALIRAYHPDTNPDPAAQSRVREITAAYAILRDPVKRAEYDALPNLLNEPQIPEEAPVVLHSKRSTTWGVGLSAALVLVLTLGLEAWPELRTPPISGNSPTITIKSKPARMVSVRPLTPSKRLVVADALAPRSPALPSKIRPIRPTPVTETIASKPSLGSPAKQKAEAAKPIVHKKPSSTKMREMGQVATNEKPLSRPRSVELASRQANPVAAAPDCGPNSQAVGNACAEDGRRAQIERIATSFLKQSLEHADWHKEQLLLSARNRSDFSRAMCRSNDCLIAAYMRQMRDTSEIMQGRIPTP